MITSDRSIECDINSGGCAGNEEGFVYTRAGQQAAASSLGRAGSQLAGLPATFARPGWLGSLIGPTIQGDAFRFLAFYLPFGQARPFHIAENLQLVFFMLEGEMEVGVGPEQDHLEYYRIGKYDSLFVPVGMGVDYRNVGQTDVRYVQANSRVGEWPKECIYNLPWEENPFVRKF